MSDIDDLIASIQRQLLKNGINEVLIEIKKADSEVQKIQDIVSSTFQQDFRYDNVEPLAISLRASRYEMDALSRSAGMAETVIGEVVQKIRYA